MMEQVEANKIAEQDLHKAKMMIETRDSEIRRLSLLYEANVNLDKLGQNYTLEKLQRQNENLLKQLEFVNSENNKLASLQANSNENTKSINSKSKEVIKLTQKLQSRDTQLQEALDELKSKTELVQRLTEQ